MDEMNGRMMKQMQSDPELVAMLEKAKSQPKSDKAAMQKVIFERIKATDAEIKRLNNLVAKSNGGEYPAGPLLPFQVQRKGNLMSFRLKPGTAIDETDTEQNAAIELLSSLQMKLDASDAQLMGYSLGAAQWHEAGNAEALSRGVEWKVSNLPIKAGGVKLGGKQIDNGKLDAVLWCVYSAEKKHKQMSIAIWPSGGDPAKGNFARFVISNFPAGPTK